MKVKALVSFVGTTGKGKKIKKVRAQPGDIVDMQPGTDWIKAGIVAKATAAEITVWNKAQKEAAKG